MVFTLGELRGVSVPGLSGGADICRAEAEVVSKSGHITLVK
jgi:hypothetical protein